MSQEYKYFAFISYSRKDSRAAAWLQKRLEWFRFPVKLLPEGQRPPDPRYVRPIYRDKTNLEVTDEHYWKNIRRALDESRFLIVLASPHSANSDPVEMEVSHFLASHGLQSSLIVPMILSGSVTSVGDDAALCPTLRELGESITSRNLPTMLPDAGSAEQDAWEQGFIALVSYLLRLDRSAVGDHLQREMRKQSQILRRWLVAISALTLMVIFGAWYGWNQAVKARAATSVAETESEKAVIARAEAEKQAALATESAKEAETQRTAAQLALVETEKQRAATQSALSESNRQLERSQVKEGLAWLERAKAAMNEDDGLRALMYAGRAVGYFGYGRKEEPLPEKFQNYPALLGKIMSDPDTEAERIQALKTIDDFVTGIRPTLLPIWGAPTEDPCTTIVFSPDGLRFACASANDFDPVSSRIEIWDAATGQSITKTVEVDGAIKALSYSSSGRLFVSGGDTGSVTIWDAFSGVRLTAFNENHASVTGVAISPDDAHIAAIFADGVIATWEMSSTHIRHTVRVPGVKGNAIAFSPDSSRLAAGFSNGMVRVFGGEFK